MNIQKKI